MKMVHSLASTDASNNRRIIRRSQRLCKLLLSFFLQSSFTSTSSSSLKAPADEKEDAVSANPDELLLSTSVYLELFFFALEKFCYLIYC